jgi:hypothetical protein
MFYTSIYIDAIIGPTFFVSLKNKRNRIGTSRDLKYKFEAEINFLTGKFCLRE